MKQKLLKKRNILPIVALLFLLSSCIDGYKDDWTFSSGVENVTLESPDTVMFAKNAEGTILTVSWPVVYGALNYEFSFYDVTDVNNPMPIIEKELVDGCYKLCNIEEDSNYKVTIRAIGDPKLNNKDAASAIEMSFSTMIPAIVIPNGADLFAWFNENGMVVSAEEAAYELEAGGNYTITGEVRFDSLFTLRGNKANYPTLTYDVEGRIVIGKNGFKIKFIDVNCDALQAGTTGASFLTLGDAGEIKNPILIQSCNIKGLNRHLIHDGGRQCIVSSLIIKDCIVASNSTAIIIGLSASHANALSFTNSTFYGLVASSTYFIQYRNNARGATTGVNFTNCTLYNISTTGQMANYSGFNNSTCTLTLNRNIFANCGDRAVVRRLSAGNNNIKKELAYNCYWYDANNDGIVDYADNEEMGHNNGDKSGTGFYENPFFTENISDPDPVNVNFKPGSSALQILLNRCGDPRWLQ